MPTAPPLPGTRPGCSTCCCAGPATLPRRQGLSPDPEEAAPSPRTLEVHRPAGKGAGDPLRPEREGSSRRGATPPCVSGTHKPQLGARSEDLSCQLPCRSGIYLSIGHSTRLLRPLLRAVGGEVLWGQPCPPGCPSPRQTHPEISHHCPECPELSCPPLDPQYPAQGLARIRCSAKVC